jgi:NTP pyrophosphatase (non-canonical NTP hydrolase)
MSDQTTTVADLRKAVDAFVAARDWHPFHNAKDLAVSIAIETAELLEEFQWQDAAQVTETGADPDARERVRQELADVLIYCLSLSNALQVDISDAVRDKLVLSGQKYPAEAYRGQYRKPGEGGRD